MDIERFLELIDDIYAIKEELKEDYIKNKNPGIKQIYKKLKDVIRTLGDIEDIMLGLTEDVD